MSIESKHAYRFGYLKSEQWKTVRLEALVREKAKCQICSEESISNDAHHIWYPENIYETRTEQLVILCRGCHDFIHAMMPECKTRDEEEGAANWMKFKNAIVVWRLTKSDIFADVSDLNNIHGVPRALRNQLVKITAELTALKAQGLASESKIKTPDNEAAFALNVIKKWRNFYLDSLNSVNLTVAQDDFQI